MLEKISLILTIKPEDLLFGLVSDKSVIKKYHFVGRLDSREVLNTYLNSHALLFLSTSESLGIPLIEATELGMPIIAPNLPYVDAAISNYYDFDIQSSASLINAVKRAKKDILEGCAKKPSSTILCSPEIFLTRMLSK